MYERFTDRARKVMQLAVQEARQFNHEYVGTEHILLGLVQEGSGVATKVLQNLGIDLRKIRLEIEKLVQHGPGGEQVVMAQLPYTARVKKVIEYSVEEARNLNHNYVGTEHLLLGLLREQKGVAAQVLMNLGLKLEGVCEEVLNLLGHNMPTESEPGGASAPKPSPSSTGKNTPVLDSFGRDLTELARQGKLNPVIGRATEIERLFLILSRRQKKNSVLLGEVGVGKTAIVEGLAQLVVDENKPKLFREKRIVALDLEKIVAGMDSPEGIKKRVKAVIQELREVSTTILFIDDLHTFMSASGVDGGFDASNLLRPALASGEIQCIGATTPADYRRHIVKDAALADQFHEVFVSPPSRSEAEVILMGCRHRYEAHHRVRITDGAIHTAVELTCVFMPERVLPRKAIDVIDEAGARERLRTMNRPPDLKELDEQIEKLNQEKEAAVMEQDLEKAVHLRDQAEKLCKKKELTIKEWRNKADAIEGVVNEETVVEIVSYLTGFAREAVRNRDTSVLPVKPLVTHGVSAYERKQAESVLQRGEVQIQPGTGFVLLPPTPEFDGIFEDYIRPAMTANNIHVTKTNIFIRQVLS